MITVKQEYLAEVNLLNGQFCVDIAKIKPAKSMRVIGRMEFFRSNRPVFSRQTPFVGKSQNILIAKFSCYNTHTTTNKPPSMVSSTIGVECHLVCPWPAGPTGPPLVIGVHILNILCGCGQYHVIIT